MPVYPVVFFADRAGFGFCILSLLCAVLLGLFDRRAERILKRKENGTGEQISFKDIKDFPLRLWLVFIICVAYYVTVFPFIGLATYVCTISFWNKHLQALKLIITLSDWPCI